MTPASLKKVTKRIQVFCSTHWEMKLRLLHCLSSQTCAQLQSRIKLANPDVLLLLGQRKLSF